jgi:hypothetical protein
MALGSARLPRACLALLLVACNAAGGAKPGDGGAAGAPAMPRADAAGDQEGPIAASCSDTVLRTGPPPGKELFHQEPIDTRFPFSTHWIGEFSSDPRYIGMTSLADLDHDGDLDFASGQRQDLPGGMVWWEYCSPDHWVRHAVGSGHASAAGGNAADVDGDGWIDLLAGNSWYRNPHTPRTSAWQRYTITQPGAPAVTAPGAEELIVGDVTGDGKPAVLYVWRTFQPQLWLPGADATQIWTRTNLTTDPALRQQQGGAIGDIDGDGDNDVLVGYRWWYRNTAGDGSAWETVTVLPTGAFDNEPLTYLGDLDGDGDLDFMMATHFGARVAWAENLNGIGTQFALHILATDKSFLHTIVAADFDNDGDLDIFAGQNVGPSFIFENTDGRGTFVEHQVAADWRAHDARVADVDCDGDLDIAGAPWGDPTEGGEQSMPPRDHTYMQNMLVERGGRALFQRQPYEVLYSAQSRVCP